MSRVVVVGMGVPALVPSRRHAGPGLRSSHLARAVAHDGHDVLLLAVLDEHEQAPPLPRELPPRVAVEWTRERDLAAVRTRVAAWKADAVVGAGAYASSLAARLGLGVPLWADVFGDLMAEAQAKAARTGSDWSLVHFWTLLRDALEAGDRFSAVSVAQSHALLGQLGLAGRLGARTAAEELVAVMPCAAPWPETSRDGGVERRAARADLGLEVDDFVVLLSGGVNTWCDVATTVRGLEAAMAAEPRLRVVVTGGAIPGHDEQSSAELVAGLARMAAGRVRVLGWIDDARLATVYAAADLGLHVELPLVERTLGAENRVVEWAAHGLACVTTGLSETGRHLVDQGLALGCRAGDAADLARILVAAAGTGRDEGAGLSRTVGARARDWALRERDPFAVAAPLRAWCREPRFARDRDGARLVRLGLLSHPETSVEMLEAYVAALPMRELVRRGLRWAWRRGRARFVNEPPAGVARGGREPAAGPRTLRDVFRASGRRW